MPVDQRIKDRAYQIDPECWVSYSGKPKAFKQIMEGRRASSMRRAAYDIGPPPSRFYAIPCPCGHDACDKWMVSEVAEVQGVRFTQEQAQATADLLNTMEALTPEAMDAFEQARLERKP